MNIHTISYISYVAGMASDKVKNGSTLLSVKRWVEDCLQESTSPVDEWDLVNWIEAKLALQILVGECRKNRFIYNAEGLVKNMNKAREAHVASLN